MAAQQPRSVQEPCWGTPGAAPALRQHKRVVNQLDVLPAAPAICGEAGGSTAVQEEAAPGFCHVHIASKGGQAGVSSDLPTNEPVKPGKVPAGQQPTTERLYTEGDFAVLNATADFHDSGLTSAEYEVFKQLLIGRRVPYQELFDTKLRAAGWKSLDEWVQGCIRLRIANFF